MATTRDIGLGLLRVAGWILLSFGYWFAAALVGGAAIMGDCGNSPAMMAACTAAKAHTFDVMACVTVGLYAAAIVVEWCKPWFGLAGLAAMILFCLLLVMS